MSLQICTFSTPRRAWQSPPPAVVPNVTAHPSTATVPILCCSIMGPCCGQCVQWKVNSQNNNSDDDDDDDETSNQTALFYYDYHTHIYNTHTLSNSTESEAPAVTRWAALVSVDGIPGKVSFQTASVLGESLMLRGSPFQTVAAK